MCWVCFAIYKFSANLRALAKLSRVARLANEDACLELESLECCWGVVVRSHRNWEASQWKPLQLGGRPGCPLPYRGNWTKLGEPMLNS